MNSFRHHTRLPILLAAGAAAALPLLAGCGGSSNKGATPFANNSTGVNTPQTELTYGVQGSRGYMPILAQSADGTTVNEAIDADETVQIGTSSNQSLTLTAPTAYADRSFVGWQQGGQTVSTNPAYTFTPANLAASGPLVLLYQPLPPTNGAFTPNFTRAGFPTWDHMPVNVYLNSTIAPGSSNYTSIVNGMNRWVSASGGALSYQLVTDPSKADITIGFGSTPSGLAGLTTANWDANLNMTSATIALNPPVAGPNEILLQNLDTIVAHEFGHALGLVSDTDLTAGHSTDPNDTMYVTGNTQIGLITNRDINTMATNYPAIFNGAASKSAQSGRSAVSHAGPAVHHAVVE